MKVFRVVTERDGIRIDAPGKSSTDIMRDELRYAAETIQDVWNAIEWIRLDEERTILAIIEEAPAITVVQPKDEEPK